jgi:uncharacterized repeat protein (TIGR02543 family)
MATIYKWTPFGVALDITATSGTVTRKTATQYEISITASWETYYSGAKTNYGMNITCGGTTRTISAFNGTSRSSGTTTFTQAFSISGNGAATKTITVAFTNFNTDTGDTATKNISFNVTVPAWTSYVIKYNANGGTGAPGNQTKWKGQTLVLTSTKPTRTGYSFLGWSASSTATTQTYNAGGNYTSDSAATLYAVWKANTYTVTYNANGGTGAPGNQTKTYGQTLVLSTVKPTKTNYNFKGWGTSASSTTVSYASGANYTNNAAITLYAVWELAYTKPRISNISVSRCDHSGNPSDEGKYAKVEFDWSTDKPATEAVIEWISNDNKAKVRSVEPISELSINGDWIWYDNVNITDDIWIGAEPLTYECDGKNYIEISIYDGTIWYYDENYNSIQVYNTLSGWTDEKYKTISIKENEWVYPQYIIDFIYSNATKALAGPIEPIVTIPLNDGTSGTISQIFGEGKLTPDHTHTIIVRVSDTDGNTSINKTLSGYRCYVDFLNGNIGTGVSIGKPAEKDGVFEVALNNEFHGTTTQIGNRFVCSANGKYSVAGYVLLASIKVDSNDATWPITFVLNQRRASTTMTLHMTLSSSSSLSTFVYEGSNYNAYLYQEQTAVWNLYVQKASADDTITIQDWYTAEDMNEYVTVTFLNDMAWSLPTPYYKATPAQLRSMLDFIYPVGSVYISYSHVDPATMFGGTWTRIENAFLWGCDSSGTIGQTGGEKTHTLTIDELPAHTHGSVYSGNATGSKSYPWLASGNANMAYGTVSAGGGLAHNNMPPYIQVSIWRRTA